MWYWIEHNEARWLFVVLTAELGVSMLTCYICWKFGQEKAKQKIKRTVSRFLKSLGVSVGR